MKRSTAINQKSHLKRIKNYLYQWDGIWSIPLAILLFLMAGVAGHSYWGAGFAAYDPCIFQAALLSTALVIFFNTVAWLGIYMNFPSVYTYYRNESSISFQKLKPWQKLFILGSLYAGFLSTLVILTLRLV